MDLPDHIRLREIALTPDTLAEAERMLSPAEQARRAAFKSAARRDSFALGRFAARSLLAESLGRVADSVELAIQDNGSVDVADSHLNLSISHSGPYAAAAIADTDIGLDLERVRPRPETLFRFMLHPEEMSLRDRIDLPVDRQIVLFWALKESVLKAKRTGLRRSPKTLRLEIDLAAGRARISGRREWDACFDLRDDHVLAVSWPVQ